MANHLLLDFNGSDTDSTESSQNPFSEGGEDNPLTDLLELLPAISYSFNVSWKQHELSMGSNALRILSF